VSETHINALMDRYSLAATTAGQMALRAEVLATRWMWRWRHGGPDAVKRASDIVLGLLALVVLSPVFLLIFLLIKLEDGGPIFFIQKRVGQFGREFQMYKFRSMCLNAEEHLDVLLACNHHKEGVTFKIKRDPRVTRVGSWLRKFSLDELPQFYNVVQGKMSLVGPRPPVPREVALYGTADRRRLAAKPGITCTWQISGRSEIDFSRQVQLDVTYIENQSFWGDAAILVRTLPAVVSGKGAC
jgi:lipopolysaccharide/colanic/teichoic acid biosynthesis glycosyltransferase